MSDLTDMLEEAIRYGIDVEVDFYGGGQNADKYIVEPARLIAEGREGTWFTVDSLAAAMRQVAHDLKWCKHSDEWHAVAHPDPEYPHEDHGPLISAAIIQAAKEAERE